MKIRRFVVAFLLTMGADLPNRDIQASIIDYGVYKVEAAIRGDDLHPGMTKIDSKAPGLWSTRASASVSDSYGSVYNAWSICPLGTDEAQVNIKMGFSDPVLDYVNSSAGQGGEIHFNYHSDTPFTVTYYWDLTWDIDHPKQNYNPNVFAQQVKLRIYDSQDNWWDPIWLPYPAPPKWYPAYGRYVGSTQINVGAGDWLFIVFDSGSAGRYGGDWESMSGYVYLDFDGGDRVLVDADFNDDGIVNLVDFSYMAQTWMLSSGQDGYLEICDLVKDDVIDLKDLLIFFEYWLK
jgi:hypothetical protein